VGFSWFGLVLAAVILGPNLLYVALPPRNAPVPPASAGLLLTVLERAGQAVTVTLLVMSGGHLAAAPWWWVLPSGVCVVAYWGLWARYLWRGREFAALYAPLGPLPIPMAVLPLVAFGIAAVTAGWTPLLAAVGVLTVGHMASSRAAWASVPRDASVPPR
jgi:hypothetical protein